MSSVPHTRQHVQAQSDGGVYKPHSDRFQHGTFLAFRCGNKTPEFLIHVFVMVEQ